MTSLETAVPVIGCSPAEFVWAGVPGVVSSEDFCPHPARIIAVKDSVAGSNIILFFFIIFLCFCFVRCLIAISTGEMGANRTFMLVVVGETTGLPLECAQLVTG